MRKLSLLLILLSLTALTLTFAGCATSPTSASTGEYVDDSVITAKVKAELASDKAVSVFKIGVETYKGVVQLSGFVNTRLEADEAAAIAKKVAGVREVKNSLVVKGQ